MSSPTQTPQTPPSPTPSPAKSRWARVGGVVRRASSVLVPARPTTPSGDKDDTASIKGSLRRGSFSGINTSSASLAPPSTSHEVSAPSPIAESPARELAATEDAPHIGPSPLSQAQTAEPPAEPPAPAEPTVSPQGYVPPPLIDSTAVGPGGFTDEPDELPQSEPIQDPYRDQSRTQSVHAPEPPVTQEAQPAQPQPQPAAPEPQPAAPEPQPAAPEPQPAAPVPQPAAPEAQSRALDPQPEPEPEPTKPAEPEPVAVPEQTPQPEAHIPTEPNTSKPPSPVPTTPPPIAGEAASYFEIPTREDPSGSTDKAKDVQAVDQHDRSVISKDNTSMHSREIAFPSTPPSHSTVIAPEPKAITPQPFDLDSGEQVWRGYDPEPPVSRSMPNGGPSDQSKTPSIHDPFSDPVAPRISIVQPEYSQSMPNPYDDPHNVPYGDPPYNMSSSPQYSPIAPGMPLPIHEPAPRTISNHSPIDMPISTDERQPLLGKGPQKNPYLLPGTATGSVVQVSPQDDAAWPSTIHSPRLHSLGWIEYHLPDGTLYYVHPTRRVVTDINLREHKWMDTVTDHIDHYRDASHTAAGTELWIQTSEITRRGFLPPRFWVDHKARTVTVDTSVENGYVHKKAAQPDDQLDAEYRYWAFMESHPSHAALPTNARAEAMDALTWSWTDRLLPSNRTIPAPFSQDECQELMSILRSFNAEQGETGLQTVVHTRIVSRILMRVAHWRQHYFRPNKPLPSDVGAPAPVKYRRPILRTLFDIIIGCLCLGIPYLLFDRHRQARLDEEGGYRNATPMAVIGACTCLIAAIVLSATITFLSLPGLDGLSRIAGFVAILFSSFSMLSTVVAVFRYKADLEHPVSHLGVEGLMLISRRSFVMSLPLVFLAYSIIAVITAIVLHSFHGASTNNMLPQEPMQDSTKWTVMGALGGLAGMLTTSVLLGGH